VTHVSPVWRGRAGLFPAGNAAPGCPDQRPVDRALLVISTPIGRTLVGETGTVLHEPGSPVEHVYFPTSGLVSMLAIMKNGQAIETAVIGREGVVGGEIGSVGAQSAGQAMVQIEGSALRIGAAPFLKVLNGSNGFRSQINRFQSVVVLQAHQSAACHAFHSVDARLCRWLLQAADTVESNMVNLTQEFLSHMLGCQRTSVTLAAHALQKSGLIRYARGKIEILDRPAIEECACECYGAVRQEIDKAVPPVH
jgi:CRP-like cAMP-binding protein